MLLLYLKFHVFRKAEIIYLHSTMLLLYHCPGSCDLIIYLYLHSTMLLLYLFPSHWPPAVLLIYIPLCFYFIGLSWRHLSLMKSFTFHYASTLSFQLIPKRKNTFFIYIPLCFYFIGTSKFLLLHPRQIYIPLCFYFILIISISDYLAF